MHPPTASRVRLARAVHFDQVDEARKLSGWTAGSRSKAPRCRGPKSCRSVCSARIRRNSRSAPIRVGSRSRLRAAELLCGVVTDSFQEAIARARSMTPRGAAPGSWRVSAADGGRTISVDTHWSHGPHTASAASISKAPRTRSSEPACAARPLRSKPYDQSMSARRVRWRSTRSAAPRASRSKALVEPLAQLVQGQAHRHGAASEFERQRNAIETPGDVGDGGHIGRLDLERRIVSTNSILEKLDRLERRPTSGSRTSGSGTSTTAASTRPRRRHREARGWLRTVTPRHDGARRRPSTTHASRRCSQLSSTRPHFGAQGH